MPTPNYPYTIGTSAVTVIVDGKPFTFTSSEADGAAFRDVVDAIRAGRTADQVLLLCDHYASLRKAVAADTSHDGRISFNDNFLLVDGVPVEADVLLAKLRQLLAQGIAVKPWLKLIENIWGNPASYARDEFLLWFEQAQMPITPDGCFIAYKRVRDSYFDIHSNTIEYRPGTTVEMDRSKVDPDRHRTCSAGLHFCSRQYLPHFSSHGNNDRVVLVKINPADVVSIPSDYNNAKGRAWRMEVIGEVPLDSIEGLAWDPIYRNDDNDAPEDEEGDDTEEPETLFVLPHTVTEVHEITRCCCDNKADRTVELENGNSSYVLAEGESVGALTLVFFDENRGHDLFAYDDNGETRFMAGCRNMTVSDAITHCRERILNAVRERDDTATEYYQEMLEKISEYLCRV